MIIVYASHEGLIWLLCSVQFEVFFRCFSAAFDQITGRYFRCDRTSDQTTSIITEDGTYAEHLFETAVPFPIMETMWSMWSDQDNNLSDLTSSNLVLVTCSTGIPSIKRFSAVALAATFLLLNTIHLFLAMFSTHLFILTHFVMLCNSTCRFSHSSTEVGDAQNKAVSSAYITTLAFLTTYGKSFIKTWK